MRLISVFTISSRHRPQGKDPERERRRKGRGEEGRRRPCAAYLFYHICFRVLYREDRGSSEKGGEKKRERKKKATDYRVSYPYLASISEKGELERGEGKKEKKKGEGKEGPIEALTSSVFTTS